MIVYIVRHGESRDDVEDAYGGIADYPLTPEGRNSAQTLASQLAASGIARLYSSPYSRALQTAEILKDTLQCDVKQVPDLRERNSYGVLSGTTKAVATQIFAHVLRDLRGKPGDYYSTELLVGAEPLEALFRRVRAAVDWVLADAEGKAAVGIVTHGNVTRSIYEHILGVDRKIDLDHLAMTVLDWDGNKLHLKETKGVSYGAQISRG